MGHGSYKFTWSSSVKPNKIPGRLNRYFIPTKKRNYSTLQRASENLTQNQPNYQKIQAEYAPP